MLIKSEMISNWKLLWQKRNSSEGPRNIRNVAGN